MGPGRIVTWRELGLLCMLFNSLFSSVAVSASNGQIHVVHLSPNRPNKDDPAYSHRGYLHKALGGNDSVDGCLIYCYTNVFDGFAAKLTPEQASKLANMEGVISVVPNSFGNIQTTNSWKFLGVESPTNPKTGVLWERANYGKDVIVGVIDSGIWPESASFSDDGMGPVPARWKGNCTEGDMFSTDMCNRKLIGAKFFHNGNPGVTSETFLQDYNSARDIEGHGTHTASTAAGNFAAADTQGYANGTAKGGAPHARIAVYKVCWVNADCSFADMVAAIDEAINDGVDLITISISGYTDTPFYQDVLAVSSYHAMRKNILVSFSGGNDGPFSRTVSHNEPWAITVAAGSTDRFLGADIHIGLEGNALPSIKIRGSTRTKFLTFTSPIAKFNITSKFCFNNTLDPSEVNGKIVFCSRGDLSESLIDKANVVYAAGGVGVIVGNADDEMDYTLRTDEVNFGLPGVLVAAADASRIQAFLSKCEKGNCGSRKPLGTFFSGKTFTGVKPSPVMADFSSRGPSGVTPAILKPDITAPGVNILAAYNYDLEPYVLMSGTSMAAPHIAGIATLLKAIHPRWSPAAIKSAIMTSAKTLDNTKKTIKNADGTPAQPFVTGSGFVNPTAAVDPGLIYDAGPRDYSLFLCSLGYSDQNVETITGETNFCTKEKYFPSASNLNYPSLSVANLTQKATVITRRVSNVGKPKCVYTVSVRPPKGVKVIVSPSILRFTRLYETKSFTVKLQRTLQADYSQETYVFGSYTWSNAHHRVRSPIVLGTLPPTVV